MVRIVVDSTFGLTEEFAEQNGIKKVDLTITLGSREFKEGYRTDWAAFYDAYAAGKIAAKSSQPSPQLFVDAVNEIFAEDERADVVIFTIGDRLSGTIGSANIAAAQFEGKNVRAIDSHNGGVSALLFLKEMLDAAERGMEFDEFCAYAEKIRDDFSTVFVPASLTELARGGRVNKLISCIGNILNLKPIFEYTKNELKVIAKPLGIKRAMQTAVNILPEQVKRIAVLYIGTDTLVEPMKDKLFRRYGFSHIDVEPLCPVAGAHIGIGTVGIAFMK